MPALALTRSQKTAQRHARIIALWDQGLCNSQIAERLGYSRGTVSRALTKAGRTSITNQRHRHDGIGGQIVRL